METFSPVAMIKSISVILSIVAFHDYEIRKIDEKSAFVTDDVYMARPEGFLQSMLPNMVSNLEFMDSN